VFDEDRTVRGIRAATMIWYTSKMMCYRFPVNALMVAAFRVMLR